MHEVGGPSLLSGIEQSNNLSAARIECREIGPFEFVAAVARKGEIAQRIVAAMLPSNYVLNLMFEKWSVNLAKMTVLAPLAGAFANGLAQRGCHFVRLTALSVLRALA
jgi:hypothetical protein